MKHKYSMYSLSLRTLSHYLDQFRMSYIDYAVDIDEVKDIVKKNKRLKKIIVLLFTTQ